MTMTSRPPGRGRPRIPDKPEQEMTQDEKKASLYRKVARRYRESHAEEYRQYQRGYREKNRKKIRAYQRNYMKAYHRRKQPVQ